jgi:hypothetical protein
MYVSAAAAAQQQLGVGIVCEGQGVQYNQRPDLHN